MFQVGLCLSDIYVYDRDPILEDARSKACSSQPTKTPTLPAGRPLWQQCLPAYEQTNGAACAVVRSKGVL